jgi:filamentous hemagglutinin family protein
LVVYWNCLLGNIPLLHAQVSPPISSSGLNTQISAPIFVGGKTQYNITGGTRPGGGTNLFHSFGDFNVPNNSAANFLNDSGLATSNILGRVTGGNTSNVFGTIQTTGFGNANLFLMNPAGFLFGPNATVNVGGMVTFTSADYLRLTDNDRFNAVPGTADVILTAEPVAAFGFLGSNPGAITVQGSQLSVTSGQSISLVGGSITVQSGVLDDGLTIQPARVSAPGGQIALASVASGGEILAGTLVQAPNIAGESFSAMGNIAISEGAILDVSADAAGTVRIRGGQLVVANAMVSADTVNSNGAPIAIDINSTGNVSISNVDVPALTARTTGSGDAGEIQISSNSMQATGSFLNDFIQSVIDTKTSGSGKGGSVNITTGDFQMTGDFLGITFIIDSGTIGTAGGHGGDVNITASSITMLDANVTSGSGVAQFIGDANGAAGNITLKSDSVHMSSSSFDASSTFFSDTTGSIGRAGDVTVTSRDVQIDGGFISAQGFERGGAITVNADQLVLTGNAQIVTQTNLEPGGGITISANVVELTQASTLVSNTGGDGDAGSVRVIATDHFSLLDGIDNFRPTSITTTSVGTFGSGLGHGGDVFITTPRLEMTSGARILTTAQSNGRAGNVTINSADSISISGEFLDPIGEPLFNLGNVRSSGIVTSTVGGMCSGSCGDAGHIFITTGSLDLGNGAQINSGTSSSGRGGNITITAGNTIALSGTLSTGEPVGIQSRTVGADADAGAGGNISLVAGQSVSISNDASVSASTTGPGNAGNILVKANDISLNGSGTITAASTGAGNAGTVTIQGLNSPANTFLVDGAGSGVFTNTEDIGAGGKISVDANAVTIQNGGTVSASTSGSSSSATGGDISISGGQYVQINNGASITASSSGPGNTGNIQINAGNQFAMTNSAVTTEAKQSGGGAIKITTAPNGTVQLTNSSISASVLDGTGGGGSVDIDPQFVILQNSQITANAVSGPGGNIFITTNLLLPDSTSVISASSQFGQQGTITIQSPVSPASGKINPLGQKPLITAALVNQRCAALAGGSISSFTVAGRDSLPAEPGGWLASPLALAAPSVGAGLEARGEGEDGSSLLSLRQLGPTGFLTQVFAVEPSGCQS